MHARYSTFTVGNTTTDYRLLVSGYSGTTIDALRPHSGNRFTTIDRDNDPSGVNCALEYSAGLFWCYSCYTVSLNGKYYHMDTRATGYIRWSGPTLKNVSMKIRRK